MIVHGEAGTRRGPSCTWTCCQHATVL